MQKHEQRVVVNNKHGLHARPAALFVQLANKYHSSVRIEKDGEMIDAKSIIGLLSLGVNRGMAVNLIVEGPDAAEALEELKQFLEKDHE